MIGPAAWMANTGARKFTFSTRSNSLDVTLSNDSAVFTPALLTRDVQATQGVRGPAHGVLQRRHVLDVHRDHDRRPAVRLDRRGGLTQAVFRSGQQGHVGARLGKP